MSMMIHSRTVWMQLLNQNRPHLSYLDWIASLITAEKNYINRWMKWNENKPNERERNAKNRATVSIFFFASLLFFSVKCMWFAIVISMLNLMLFSSSCRSDTNTSLTQTVHKNTIEMRTNNNNNLPTAIALILFDRFFLSFSSVHRFSLSLSVCRTLSSINTMCPDSSSKYMNTSYRVFCSIWCLCDPCESLIGKYCVYFNATGVYCSLPLTLCVLWQ